jgi:dihydroorotate dehydrogenase (fumarate)
MITLFPKAGQKKMIRQITCLTEKAKELLNIPLFASLNAVNDETWIDYAKKIEETGVMVLKLTYILFRRKEQIEE